MNKTQEMLKIPILLSALLAGLAPSGIAEHAIDQNSSAIFTEQMPGLVTYRPADKKPIDTTDPATIARYHRMADESLSTFQFLDIPFHYSLGPVFIDAQGRKDTGLGATLRYQLSPSPWDNTTEFPWHIGPLPLALSAEIGGILPHRSPIMKSERRVLVSGGNTTTYAVDERLKYEAHVGLVNELPHGHQTIAWPEIGLGVSAIGIDTKAQAYVTNGSMFVGHKATSPDESKISPWVMAGVRLFPTHFFSGHLGVSFYRYPNQLEFDGQSFNTSLSGWMVAPMLQIQMVWPSHIHVALTPKRLPPWLMPAYTTEEISPWVAAPEIVRDPKWTQKGQTFGNVMFQFKSRWVDKVELLGDFNDWTPEPMVKDRGGYWVAIKDLPSGQHHYTFLLNGKREIRDPWNKLGDPDQRPRGSSIVIVP